MSCHVFAVQHLSLTSITSLTPLTSQRLLSVSTVCRSVIQFRFKCTLPCLCKSLIISEVVKGRLLACKRWPFSVQLTAFWKVKGGILQSRLLPCSLQVTANIAAEGEKYE
jgi:hypothetical protein